MATKSETGLKRLYRGSSTARMLLDYFASREKNRESTSFARVLAIMAGQDEPPTRSRVREVFRTLEKLGYGTFIVGRRGHQTRFIWSVPLTEVGVTAQIPAVPVQARSTRRRKVAAKATTRGRRKIAA